MTADHLDDLFRATPFEPFVLCLADGRSLHVGAADCMTQSENGRTIFIHLPQANETELVDLALVVSIRFSEPTPDTAIAA